MSPTTAKTLVVVSYLAMVALIALNKSGKYVTAGSKFKAVYAASWLGLGLSIAADVAPKVAGPLAILALIAVAVKNPGEIGPLAKGTSPPTSVTGG